MPDLLGNDGLPVRGSGIWAKEKLYYLERYLDIFSVGMQQKWHGSIYYVDLFAGPGQCRITETGEEFDGSPLIALKFNFAKYFFFESDPACFKALETRIRARAPEKLRNITLIPADCNKKIDQVKPTSGALGLAFVDPTGILPIAFETIRKLAANRKIDLIINFHEGMGIRMNIHQYPKKEQSALKQFLGSDRSIKQFRTAPSSIDQVCHEITNEYRDNLRGLGYQVVDGDRIPIKTDKNALLYYLLFASKDPRGNDFWRKIGLIDPHGQRKLPGF
jgi:three-Cys-motif partner protein